MTPGQMGDDECFDDLFDGEEHELFPGKDFVPAAENLDGTELTLGEKLSAGVSDGWAALASRLNSLAKVMGHEGYAAWQRGDRYFFQYNGNRSFTE